MQWLITGGAGFIGSALVAKLLSEEQNKVVIYDDMSAGTIDNVQNVIPRTKRLEISDSITENRDVVSVVIGDILDCDKLSIAMDNCDVVVHLAANTGVAPSVEDPMKDCLQNVLGTLNVLEACRKLSVNRFVFASSGAPLGEQSPPLNENMAPRPASPYGASKLAGEGYCSAYYHTFGISTIGLRFGNVYGPGSGNKNSVIAKFLKEAIEGEEWVIFGDGTQTRDFIYVDDLVQAILSGACAEYVGGEVFQIATSKEINLIELSNVLSGVLKSLGITPPSIKNTDKRIGDVMRNYSDTRKAKAYLNWEAKTTLEEGLILTCKAFLT